MDYLLPSKLTSLFTVSKVLEKLCNQNIVEVNWQSNGEKHQEKVFDDYFGNLEFEKRTDKKIILKNVWNFIHEGMRLYEEDVNSRREKLRQKISVEEAELTCDLINLYRQREMSRIEEIRKLEEERKVHEERDRLNLVALKRQQQYLEGSGEMRDRISKEITRGVKYSNLVQILEKSSRRKEEESLDTLWYEIMMKECKVQERRELENRRKRFVSSRDTGLILKTQMADRSSSSPAPPPPSSTLQDEGEKERRESESLWDKLRAGRMQKLTEKEKKLKLKKDLEEQMMLAEQHLKQKIQQEAEVDQMIKLEYETRNKMDNETILNNMNKFRQETEAYMKSLQQFKENKMKSDVEVDAFIQKDAQDAQLKRDLAIQQYKLRQKRLLQHVLDTRKDQLKAKQQLRIEDNKRLLLEKKKIQQDLQENLAAQAREKEAKRQMMLQYHQDLRKQHYENVIMKMKNSESFKQKHLSPEKYSINPPGIIVNSGF